MLLELCIGHNNSLSFLSTLSVAGARVCCWYTFNVACIYESVHRSTGAAATQHGARVSACCSWTNYQWCIDGVVNTRLSTLVRHCIIEMFSGTWNRLLFFWKIS